MELWIRSQDKYTLIKAENIKIIETKGLKEKLENSILSCLSDMEQVKSYLKDGYSILADENNVGVYESKERAMEVLDEIQSKLKGTFLLKMKDEKYSKYIEDGKKYLENLNGIGIVTGDACFDIEPINKNIYVYEMPEE